MTCAQTRDCNCLIADGDGLGVLAWCAGWNRSENQSKKLKAMGLMSIFEPYYRVGLHYKAQSLSRLS